MITPLFNGFTQNTLRIILNFTNHVICKIEKNYVPQNFVLRRILTLFLYADTSLSRGFLSMINLKYFFNRHSLSSGLRLTSRLTFLRVSSAGLSVDSVGGSTPFKTANMRFQLEHPTAMDVGWDWLRLYAHYVRYITVRAGCTWTKVTTMVK